MAYDSTLIVYTGVATPYIPISSGQNLQLILQNIDAAINTMSAAPDYTGYNLYCITQVDGTTHPTNTRNFAEGISKIVCDNATIVDTFINTTYVSDSAVFTNAIDDLQNPAYTYVPFSITSADAIGTVFSKMFTGFTGILNAANPASASWGTLSISPSPTTLVAACNDFITYLAALATTVSDKQASIGTFNNSASCIAGGATDSIQTTIGLIKTYICALPEFTPGDITTSCLSTQANLQDWVQELVNDIDSLIPTVVTTAGTGLTTTSLGACLGKSIAINTSYAGLYKVYADAGSSDDTPNTLTNKTVGGTGITLDLTAGANTKLRITNSLPETYKVKVNSSDSTADYLETKIPSTAGTWGISLLSVASSDDSQLLLTPVITNPTLFAQNFMSYISSDPTLLAQWCSLNTQCDGCICIAPTELLVALDESAFALTWSVGATPVSQLVKYRQRGNVDWISNVNITAANPQTNTANSASVDLSSAPNIVYQFQVDSICSGTSNGSNVYEAILYDCQTPVTAHTGGIITIDQGALTTVDNVEYVLYLGATPQQTIITTGINPIATFASVAAGTYTIKWRYSTLVNGAILYSNDPSQLGMACTTGNIIIS